MNEKLLAYIDDIYSDFLTGKISRETFEKKLGDALSSIQFNSGRKHFEIAIINENQKAPFFGMYVYPVADSLEGMSRALIDEAKSFRQLCEKWRKIDDWYIEIDATCFDRKVINFSPKELTAMTIHEIGHIIESEAPVERWYRAYQDAKTRVAMTDRPSLKILYSLYQVPLVVACMQRSWVNNRNQLKLEYTADRETLKYGYGDALVSALNKIIKASGSINVTEQSKDKEVLTSMIWCNVNVTDLTHRKNRLKDDLYYQSLKTQSNFMKALGIQLLAKLGAKTTERYTGYATEMTMEIMSDPESPQKYAISLDSTISTKLSKMVEMCKHPTIEHYIATEAFGAKKKPAVPKLPSQYELDAISIEIDKITNHYDRTYVLDLIYKVLDDITIFEEYLAETDPNKLKSYTHKIEGMRKELNGLRKQCLGKKNLDKQYRLFVQYPEGYEG